MANENEIKGADQRLKRILVTLTETKNREAFANKGRKRYVPQYHLVDFQPFREPLSDPQDPLGISAISILEQRVLDTKSSENLEEMRIVFSVTGVRFDLQILLEGDERLPNDVRNRRFIDELAVGSMLALLNERKKYGIKANFVNLVAALSKLSKNATSFGRLPFRDLSFTTFQDSLPKGQLMEKIDFVPSGPQGETHTTGEEVNLQGLYMGDAKEVTKVLAVIRRRILNPSYLRKIGSVRDGGAGRRRG